MVKAIAEELRAIAQKHNIVMISATQTNREGISGEEVDLSKVSESAGLPQTTDFFAGIFQSEEQREQRMAILKVLKTRYASNTNQKIALGVNYDLMRFYELEHIDEDGLEDDNSDDDGGLADDVFRKPNRKRGR